MRLFANLPLFVAIVCVLFLAALAPALMIALDRNPHYVSDNILPGFVSSCVDGIIFVALLGFVQRAGEERRRERLRSALLSELSFLGEVIKNCILQSTFQTDELDIDPSNFRSLTESLERTRLAFEEPLPRDDAAQRKARFGVVAKIVTDHVRKALVHLRRLQPLTPIAAELSPEVLTQWTYVTDNLFDLTREIQFDDETKRTWPDVEWTYAYGRLVDLFRALSDLQVPPYRS